MGNKITRNKHFDTSPAVDKLARHVAIQLHDTGTLPFYITCCTRYPESCIRKALDKTLAKRYWKIRDRRGEFFKQVLYEYAKECHDNFGN